MNFKITMRIFLGAGLAAVVTGSACAADAPDFLRDVRPVLSSYCFKCHGPDEGSRKAGLRLDLRESALAGGKSGDAGIVPGKPEKSAIITRIFSSDEDEQMPPAKVKHPLLPEQKDILKRWVAAGAEYKPHWAFAPPRLVAPPRVTAANFPTRNAIDAFVLERMQKEKLLPSHEADRLTLCRRLYLDLIGLPPTPEEADAFVKDSRPDAYEQLVDKLLASPHYGERWARKWLDLARYADSNGYEKDRDRTIWPYRDWVIRALNADLPFDEFTIEQLAGDLLPKPTQDQLIATGFHRNTMLNEEGGIDPLEFRFLASVDRVATTGTTWLGLTTGCAQCHTHKFDPIQHKEYYGLMAFLDNADEPDMDLPPADAAAQLKLRAPRAAKLLAELPGKWPVTNAPLDDAFAKWLTLERARTVEWTALRPVEAKSNLPLLTVQPDSSVFASGDITKSDTYDLAFTNAPSRITALRLEALPDNRLPAHGPGLTYYEGPKGDFFLGEFQVSADGQRVKFAKASESYAKNNFGSGASAKAATDGDPQTGWSCAGRMGEAHSAVFIPAEPITARRLDLKMMFGRHFASSLGRFRISVTTDERGAEAREMPEELEPLLRVPDAELTATQRAQLREQFLLTTPELATAAKEIMRLRKPPTYPTTMVLRERPAENTRPTFLHHRGEYLQPKERIEPGVPAFLPALPAGAPKNRLTLARWLVAPENPLTARVVVNRHWAAIFGQGLVRTQNDFGFQGDLPTHPELLDWLALDFVKQGWSMKKLHRLMVTSSTYRQSSRVTPELLARDPQNRWLARGPRVRVDAELVRDVTLRASGLLSEKMFGAPVKPPQPAGVTEAAYGSPKWEASTGEARYRRSLYTFQKRSAPFAMFNAFDAPSGEVCLAKREVSNTPMQALTLLNDIAFLEAAQHLGDLAAAQKGDDQEKAAFILRRALTRPAQPAELEKLVAFVQAQRERLKSGELKAADLAPGGPGDATERAAWMTVARAVLNLDETITKN